MPLITVWVKVRGERFDVLGLVEHETRLLALYGTIPFID